MSLAVYERLLSDLAERCGINDAKTLRKTKELISLLNSKRSINCSEICKVLVCLELAATSVFNSVSRDIFVKLSGCTKMKYVNNLNNISKLLNIDKIYTIKEICLLVGASHIMNDALNLYKKYQLITAIDSSALEHPMYACAAILAVCDVAKHPVNLSRLLEISRVKKNDLKKLSLEFSNFFEKKQSNSTKKEEKCQNEISKKDTLQITNDYSRDKPEETSDDRFNEWKRRMLEDD